MQPDPLADSVPVAGAAVRQPILIGQWPVAALWFPADWYPHALRQSRILAYWQPGSRAFRFAQGDLLRFAASRWLDCGNLPGWPLQRLDQGLCSAALQAAELKDLPRADLWLVEGGQLLPMVLADAVVLDPSIWIATEDLVLLDTFDCQEALPEARLLIQSGASRSVREVLGQAVPPPSEALQEYLSGQEQPAGPWVRRLMSVLLFLRQVAWFVFGILWLGILFRLLESDSAEPVAGTTSQSAMPGFLVLLWLLFLPLCLGLVWLIKRWIVSSLRQLAGSAARSAPVQQAEQGGQVQPDGAQLIVANPQSLPATSPALSAGAHRPAVVSPLRERIRHQLAPQHWRNWMVRLARASLVSHLIATKQSDHLNRVMRMFKSGQLDEALRNAVPLGGKPGESLGQAFGTPKRRKSLELSRFLSSGPSITLAGNAEDELRRLYRAGFEKLDRAGRIDEAVFVLAELLQNRAEALEYLEQHGRLTQAAELALAWDMPAQMIVRLHCLAGDWRTAVAVARRDRVFAEVVELLGQKWPDVARRMRIEWGDYLAAQGHWLEAVDAVWTVPDAREKAREWLANAGRNGGELAAKALVQRALLIPESLDEYADQLAVLRDDPLLHADRMVVADAILAMKHARGGVLRLLRLLLPMLLADQARGRGKYSSKTLQRIMSLANDRLLTGDLPSGPLPVNISDSRWSGEQGLVYSAPPPGQHPVLDAVPLADASYLAALGESGVAVVDSLGRIRYRFAVPADTLVIADSRQIALALVRRDEVWRVSRIDLVQRTATDLGMIPLQHFARRFDGVNWAVVSRGVYRVLDTQHGLGTVVWQVNDLPGDVVSFSTAKFRERLLIRGPGNSLELWWYKLPARTLAARDAVPVFGENEIPVLTPWAYYLFLGVDLERDRAALYFRQGNDLQERNFIQGLSQLPDQLALEEGWMVLQFNAENQAAAHLLGARQQCCKARLDWPSADLRNRLFDNHWLAFDGSGRLFHLDLETGMQVSLSI